MSPTTTQVPENRCGCLRDNPLFLSPVSVALYRLRYNCVALLLPLNRCRSVSAALQLCRFAVTTQSLPLCLLGMLRRFLEMAVEVSQALLGLLTSLWCRTRAWWP